MTGWANSSYGTSPYRAPNNTYKYVLQVVLEIVQSLNPKVRVDREIAYVLTDRLEMARRENADADL